MDDLRQRFATLDRVPVPDVWGDIERRLDVLVTNGPTRRVVAPKPAWRRAASAKTSAGSAARIRGRRTVALLAAATLLTALLVGGAIAVGSGIVRLSSVVPPSPSPQSSLTDTASPSPHEATPSPAPTGPLGGGMILAQSWKSLYDRGQHDVFAVDAGSGEQKLLGTLSGGPANPYTFQRSVDRDRVLVVGGYQGAAVSSLQAPTGASGAFGFIDTGKLNLTCCEGGYTESIALSPSGGRIATVHADGFENKIEVVILDVAGGGFRTIPIPSGMGGGLSWAPDESAIVAFGCRPCNKAQTPAERQTPYHGHLYVIPLDGSPWQELLDVDNGQVIGAWSPDSKSLITATWICPAGSFMPRCDPAESRASLGIVSVAGGESTIAADVPGLSDRSWSPDGRRIAYEATDGIHVVNADGTGMVKLADDAYRVEWSPDGQWLLFQRGPSDLWIVPAAGGEPRRIGTALAGAAW